MSTRTLKGLFLAVVLVLRLTTLAWGQAGNPPVPVNEYGTPDMDQIDLTPAGDYSECIYCVNLPIVGEVGLNLSYDLYSDNYGNTWVVPDPFTVIYTAIYPQAIPEGLAERSDGWSYGSLAMQVLEACGGLEALGIDVGGVDISTMGEDGVWDFVRDFIEVEEDHLQFMAAMWDTLSGLESFPLWQLSWIYGDNPFDPTDDPATPQPQVTGTPRPEPTPTPRPTPTPLPTATPRPTPISCPPEGHSQRPPSAVILDTWPPNPVVVCQGGQGFDINAQAVSYPVIHWWWVPEPTYECRWWDEETYGTPWGNKGHCCPDDQPDCNRDDYWLVPDGGEECVRHTEVIPDPILMEYFVATANLRPSSIRWIQTDLTSKYPGAHVRRPDWALQLQGQPILTANRVCVVEATAHFDFEDPGWYDIAVSGMTAGTIYTPPRSFIYVMEDPQPVYLMDTMLIR